MFTKRDWLLLIVIMAMGLLLRSWRFAEVLNFSADQGFFAFQAVEIWHQKKMVLIGPTASWNYQGRYLFQGSLIYYVLLGFLLLGHFHPIWASYWFVLFSMVMMVPLYVGVRWWAGQKAALVMTSTYAFFPLYIDYTRFLWNPNFQLALLPLLIFCVGGYERFQRKSWLVLSGLMSSVLLQFHYSFLLIIVALIVYLVGVKRVRKNEFLSFILGFAVGVSPFILFELKHDFYNLRTAWLLMQHAKEVLGGTGESGWPVHYFLTLSFTAILGVVIWWRKKMSRRSVMALMTLLFIAAVVHITKLPAREFNISADWRVEDDLRVYEIIRDSKVSNFNVANLAYNTQAWVQKYLFAKDGMIIGSGITDYTQNTYLFVVSADDRYLQNSAYEVNTFTPSQLVKTWPINATYTLYLLERSR